jgi:cytidylate kinase
MSAGGYYREIAEKEGITLLELEELAKTSPRYDLDVDGRTHQYSLNNSAFVFDGRIAWSCIQDSFKILIMANEDVCYRRIADRDKVSIEQAREDTLKRESMISTRFRELYGIENYCNPIHYQLCIYNDREGVTVEDLVKENLVTITG